MTTNTDKPKKSLLARIISLEGAMAAFGCYSLYSGVVTGEALQLFWGIMILGGLCVLTLVRRRDWKRHWEEIEAASANPAPPSPAEPNDTTNTEK